MSSTLSFLFLLLLLLLRPSSAALLRPGESISSNQTLSSGSGTFVLGFFSPSGSPSASYLGVWCNGSDVRTAVWVANRRAPVPLSRAVFRLSNSSNLEVADSNGTLLWSSDTHPSDPETTVAVLLDTGNLVLQREGGAGEILWQGFDHPTDTVLSGMPIWANYQLHNASTATSWRSPDDPSPGDFHLSIDPDTHFQGIIKRGSAKWWRGNVWSGVSFVTEGGSSSDTVVPYLAFTSSPNTWNISFSSSDLGATAWRLEHNGTAIIRVWLATYQAWQTVYTFNAAPCDSYGLCGPFGYCSPAPPTCRCLDGFEPRNRSEWDGGDHRGGCVRTQALSCDGRDEFAVFEKMKLPDYNVYLRDVGNASACMEACARNCSCLAYAYSDLWTGSATVPRCLVWVTELLDLVARNDPVAQDDVAGEDLYVRVHVPASGKKKKGTTVVVVVSVVAGIAFLAAVVACLLWRRRTRPSGGDTRKKDEEGRPAFEVADGGDDLIRTLDTGGEADHRQGLRDVPMLDYETVVVATDNFSDHNMIGRGGFGIVYKGILPGGQEVAIKRLSEESTQGVLEFKNEVVLIAQLQHRNLAKLLSCCVRGEEKLMIYEYMPNKSLELLLFDSENERALDWTKRFNIIKGIARGVRYLHEDSRLKIIHRDLKLSNILLDGDMNPKVSDFGMARIFGGGQSHANTNRVVGTYGYMSPEYAMEGLFSAKSDVYSFGVLLLEIVSSQRNTGFLSNATSPSLLSHAWDCWKGGNITQMIAPSMRDSCMLQEVVKCVHIGLLCVQDDAAQRPSMMSVVFMLENETPIDAAPSRPSFTGWVHQDDATNRIRSSEASFSVNDLSISALVGR